MGTLALAAKITHVPSMYLSELEGENKGCRQAAIDGHYEIDRRCRELGVDTIVVFDTHWLVNGGYHINCAPHFEGIYTSNELPHFIKNMPYDYDGNPELGELIAEVANEMGVHTRAHSDTSLGPEYGTLVPMRYMNADKHYKVVCISSLLMVHTLEDSAKFGLAVRKAIEEKYDGTVAVFASGSLSHRFADNGSGSEFFHKIWDPFLGSVDEHVVRLWEEGKWSEFCGMLPMYAEKCYGEGMMHDTAMLMGLVGWNKYHGKVDVVTPMFASSGTGQINAIFPVEPIEYSEVADAINQQFNKALA
ncbi:3,4-dihydroxyphenylacetate 2,3-dioxygenase [Psychrobacter sp. I-STPA10]|uniref:3,4-dihydroxyphenylacetate 2,3-dioxygenase n=1 Tax=Psychrobacter sp. I-STPA10 TaxID=2585769 RepID=UPI001E51684D|nr:3,4-dihydroxyphenylacetate 2,3-dioxygenase [Psychrobacter sp. I-STPA10]